MDITLTAALNPWYQENRAELSNHKLPIVTIYGILPMPELEHAKPMWGLMNGQTREIITEPRFTYVGKFVDGIAPCEIGEKVGYVREDGTYLIEPTVEYVEAFEIVNKIACLRVQGGKLKLYSCTEQKFLVDNEFDKVEMVGKEDATLNVELFKVWSGNKIGLLRADGIWVVTFEFNGYYFIECNMLVATKAEGGQCLLNLRTNRTLLNDVTHLSYIGESGYITYYNVTSNSWGLAKLVGDDIELLLDGYGGYEWLKNSCLVKCKVLEPGEYECFDVFNVNNKEVMIKGVEDVQAIERGELVYWFFTKWESAGILADDGRPMLSAMADNMSFVTDDLIKVDSNNFFGIFSLSQNNWLILPNFLEVLGPDKRGNFRCCSEITIGRRNKKIQVWKYMRSNGTLITREMFISGSGFNSEGYAAVTMLDKSRGRLYENGKIEEVL